MEEGGGFEGGIEWEEYYSKEEEWGVMWGLEKLKAELDCEERHVEC